MSAAWNPIENAPHDDTMVLLGFCYLQDVALVGFWERGHWEFKTTPRVELKNLRPTHWQPLTFPA
jgi:hypothetical protein